VLVTEYKRILQRALLHIQIENANTDTFNCHIYKWPADEIQNGNYFRWQTLQVFISPFRANFYMKQHTPQQKLGIYNYCIFCMPRQNYIKNTLPPKLDMNILKETNRKINKIYSFLNVNAYKLYVCIANTNGPEFRFLSSPP